MITEQYNNLLKSCKNKINQKLSTTLSLSIMAGMFISLGAIANLISQNLFEGSIGKLIGSILFSIGLILVFVASGELFTGNILLISSLLSKQITLIQLLKNWIIVYIGNFMGCIFTATLILYSKTFNNTVIHNISNLIITKESKSFIILFVLGILCNILVCLAVWMNYNSKNTTDRILVTIFPITLFVLCGFEHSVADMFYLTNNFIYNPNLHSFLILIPVTLGNIIGGCFVGTIYFIANRYK